jgi:hypothetical protein
VKRQKKTTVDIHVYLPPDLLKAMRELAKKNRRTLTAEVTIAIEDAVALSLATNGKAGK